MINVQSHSTFFIRFLYLPLVSAERAWSFAMQLKQESNTEVRKKYHLHARLRKAVKFAEELETLSQCSKFDARSKLETQVIVQTAGQTSCRKL